jgi:long-chain fatty acid transport protein
MIKRTNRYTTLAVVAGLLLAGNAFATNGYFTHGTGTKNKSMAGAGIALPEDAIDVANNPAVAPFVGDQFVVGAALFSPIRKYSTTQSQANGMCFPSGCAITIGPNNLTSDSEYFIIPHISKSWQRDNGTAWAVSFYGRGGMNTDWKGGTATFDPDGPGSDFGPMTFPGTYGAGDAGVDFNQAFLDITWAKRVNERVSLGIAGVLVAQWFEANGVATFAPLTETYARPLVETGMPGNPTALSNNGHDWAYGAGLKVGLHAALSDRVDFGIMYQSKIWMTEFDDYADLFAEQGDMDIPPDLKIGLTFKANDKTALSFDIEHIWYSDIASVGNPIALLFNCPTAGRGGTDLSTCLGGNNGGGFGWDDMTVFKLGLRYKAGEDWTWRFGYSYGEQPIPNTEMSFNILAPGVMESHITAGFTLERTKGRQFNMAAMFAPSVSVTGPQNFDPSQNVTFKMYQWELEASYSWRF